MGWVVGDALASSHESLPSRILDHPPVHRANEQVDWRNQQRVQQYLKNELVAGHDAPNHVQRERMRHGRHHHEQRRDHDAGVKDAPSRRNRQHDHHDQRQTVGPERIKTERVEHQSRAKRPEESLSRTPQRTPDEEHHQDKIGQDVQRVDPRQDRGLREDRRRQYQRKNESSHVPRRHAHPTAGNLGPLVAPDTRAQPA